jgi:hypothetical protein
MLEFSEQHHREDAVSALISTFCFNKTNYHVLAIWLAESAFSI